MKQRRLTLLAAAPLLALCLACEEPVDLQLNEGLPELVITSNFFPEETIKVDVSATQSIVGEQPLTANVSQARVVIYDGNAMEEELVYRPEQQRYETRTLIPEVGRAYTVHVSADGFDPVYAISSIPDKVVLSNLMIENLQVAELNDRMVYDFLVQVDFDDPEGASFYDLRVQQSVIPFTIAYNGDTILQEPFVKGLNYEGDVASVVESTSLLFQDKPLANRPVAIRLQSLIDPRDELPGDLIVELRTVSPEYYKFRRSLIQEQQQPSGGATNQPVLLFNNVSEGGLGVFAGYNLDVRSVAIKPRHN